MGLLHSLTQCFPELGFYMVLGKHFNNYALIFKWYLMFIATDSEFAFMIMIQNVFLMSIYLYF